MEFTLLFGLKLYYAQNSKTDSALHIHSKSILNTLVWRNYCTAPNGMALSTNNASCQSLLRYLLWQQVLHLPSHVSFERLNVIGKRKHFNWEVIPYLMYSKAKIGNCGSSVMGATVKQLLNKVVFMIILC